MKNKKQKYAWRTPWVAKGADANAVGQELEDLQNEGIIKAENILKWAQENQDSELYKCFEWNDDKAASFYRLTQARQIIANLRVVKISGGETILLRKRFLLHSAGGYLDVDHISAGTEIGEELLNQAKDDLDEWNDRYREIEHICKGVVPMIHQARNKISESINEIEQKKKTNKRKVA